MKALMLAVLLLPDASPSLAQRSYTQEQIIAYAKSIDVKTLDPSLPSQRLEDWLQSGQPHAHILMWLVQDTCQLKPDTSGDYPLCAEVRVSRNGEAGIILVQVGTTQKGIVGTPQLYGAGVEEMEAPYVVTGSAERLSELPALLDEPPVSSDVYKLYKEIVARQPIGIPAGVDWVAIRPFLSKRLAGRLESGQACEADYLGRHHSTDDASVPAWLKTCIFSGVGKQALPADWWIAGKEAQTADSFLVYVSLQLYERSKPGHEPPESGHYTSLAWPVAVKVVAEDGRFLVDDVRIFDRFPAEGPSQLLSDSFAGCDGSHWIGLAATNK